MLIPSQTIVFLGFIISANNMTFSLTLGNIVASFPAITYGPLHYRHLERENITGLKYHKENFEGKIRLSAKTITETQWWINNLTPPYILMQVLQVGVSLMVYSHPGDSGIRQS